MLAEIQFKPGANFFFTYAGRKIHFRNVRWNRFLVCWVTDYEEERGFKFTGMPIRSGINLLEDTGSYLPSLYAVNKREITKDPVQDGEYTLYVSVP